jgi:hypothetical protein
MNRAWARAQDLVNIPPYPKVFSNREGVGAAGGMNPKSWLRGAGCTCSCN